MPTPKNLNVDSKMDTDRDLDSPPASETRFGVISRTPSPAPAVDPSPPVPNGKDNLPFKVQC